MIINVVIVAGHVERQWWTGQTRFERTTSVQSVGCLRFARSEMSKWAYILVAFYTNRPTFCISFVLKYNLCSEFKSRKGPLKDCFCLWHLPILVVTITVELKTIDWSAVFLCQVLHIPDQLQEPEGVHDPAAWSQQGHPERGRAKPAGRHERRPQRHAGALPRARGWRCRDGSRTGGWCEGRVDLCLMGLPVYTNWTDWRTFLACVSLKNRGNNNL